MAIIDSTEPRSATLTARTNVVALKVTEPDFHKLADEHTDIWKAVANIVRPITPKKRGVKFAKPKSTFVGRLRRRKS